MKTAIIFGSSGLTGQALLKNLVDDNRYEKIYSVVRRHTDYLNPKVEEIVFDYKDFSKLPPLMVDHVFSCMGTTIKAAGSKEAQQVIDRDYPISISKFAKQIAAEKMVCVSSVGADSRAGNFYLRTKGEMELGVKANFPNSVFMRPSFLMGDREELRIGEKIGIGVFKVLNPFLLGGLKKFRGINVDKLSKAMIEACFKETKQVLHYGDF